MIYSIDTIREDTRRIIDENRNADSLVSEGDTETMELDELIESKIEDAARLIGLNAPSQLLESGHNFGDSIGWDAAKRCGWVQLPDDFMRLISFRMDDWERTVYDATQPGAALYERQSSRFAGIRGNPQKPVCAIVRKPEGLVLEFYGCKDTTANVAEAAYLPYPTIENGGIDISERCYRAVVYLTAALVLKSYGESQQAGTIEQTAQILISK